MAMRFRDMEKRVLLGGFNRIEAMVQVATKTSGPAFWRVWFMSLFDANHESIYGAIIFTVGKYD